MEYESILIDLYFERDWKEYKGKINSPYLYTKVTRDPMGRKHKLYKLTPAGRIVAEYLVRKFGHEVGPPKGIALEKRTWELYSPHNFSTKKMIEAFNFLSEQTGVPVDIHPDGFGRNRIVVKDLDRAMSIISSKIAWNSTRDVEKLKLLGASKAFVWLWVEFLDKNWKVLRSIPFQQEFVIWAD